MKQDLLEMIIDMINEIDQHARVEVKITIVVVIDRQLMNSIEKNIQSVRKYIHSRVLMISTSFYRIARKTNRIVFY